MRLPVICTTALLVIAAGGSKEVQDRVHKNSIGMEFVRIEAGSFTLGRFQPPYAKPVDPNAPPPPAPPGTGQMLAPGIIAEADRDKDQRLSRVELVAAANAWFDQMDSSKAGRLDRMEFIARFAAVQTQLSNRTGGPVAGQGPGFGGGRGGGRGGVAPGLFAAADADRDAFVDRGEFTTRFGTWFDGTMNGRTDSFVSPITLRRSTQTSRPCSYGQSGVMCQAHTVGTTRAVIAG